MIGNARAIGTLGIESTMKKVIVAGGHLAEATKESATQVKSMMTNALESGVTAAKRMAKQSRHVAEDLVDDAAHGIKRHPFKSIALGFGVGVGMGAMTMWMFRRNGNR